MTSRRLLPTGECWCGCGKEVGVGSFFLPGHDKVAEAKLINSVFGDVPHFLAAFGRAPPGTAPSSPAEAAAARDARVELAMQRVAEIRVVLEGLGPGGGDAALRAENARLQALFKAATCFRFGDLYVEHIVDQEDRDYGWVVSRAGKWEQQKEEKGLTREEAIRVAMGGDIERNG